MIKPFTVYDGDEQINPDSFLVPATDNNGHSVRQWFQCQPGLAKLVRDVVSGRNYPYKSNSDLLRHALLRHIKWLNSIQPVGSILAQVELINETCKTEMFNAEYDKLFTTISETVSTLLARDAEGQAVKTVLDAKRYMMEMSDGYWRGRYLKTLEDKFGHIIKNAKIQKGGLGFGKKAIETEEEE